MSTGHSIQEASEDGESLLSLACSAGYYELAEVLLRMRASVEDRGIKGIDRCVCVCACAIGEQPYNFMCICTCLCMYLDRCPILLTLAGINVFVSLRKSLKVSCVHVRASVRICYGM